MQLFCSPSSPYVRKARITLREKDLLGQIEEVMIVAMESPQALLNLNPLSKIPVLDRPGLPPLYDSPVILEYLDSLPSSRPALLPAAGEGRWQVLRLQALADGVTDACFNMVMESRREEALRSEFWQQRWLSAISRSLDRLNGEAAQWHGQFNLGILTVGTMLGYLDLRLDRLSWRKGREDLAILFDQLMERQSFKETIPKDPA